MKNRNLIKESQGIVDKPGIEWKTFSIDVTNYLCKNIEEIIKFLQNHKNCRIQISSDPTKQIDDLFHMPKWLSTLYIHISNNLKNNGCFYNSVAKLENDKLVATISLGYLKNYLNNEGVKKIIEDKNVITSILIHELQHAYNYYIQLCKSQKSSLNNYSGKYMAKNITGANFDYKNIIHNISQLFYLLDFNEMKSRLHEFSFKINDIINKNFFKNYEYINSIIRKININIINEIKKDNEIINAKALNEFKIYLTRLISFYYFRYYLNSYYIKINVNDHNYYYDFDFNIDYIKTYKQLLKIDINTIINKNKNICNDAIISFILNDDIFDETTQYNTVKKLYDKIFIKNEENLLDNEEKAKIVFKEVYEDIAALFNKPAEKYLKLIDNGYKATDIFKKLQPILLNRLNIFKKAIDKVICNVYVKNPDKWNTWIYDIIKKKYDMIKIYYQEGVKLQEKFENDQILQKAFILWNKYNSQKTEENKRNLDNYLNEKSK